MGSQDSEPEPPSWPKWLGFALVLGLLAIGAYRTWVLGMGRRVVPGLPAHLQQRGKTVP